jgi:respiratory burst oxidase
VAWAIDLLLRYVLTVHTVKATVDVLPADVVRVRFPRNFSYLPGQYCFISVPALSHFQFHPFTISSAPHEIETKFHIRSLGNWTSALHSYVMKNGTTPPFGPEPVIKSMTMDVSLARLTFSF